MFIVAKSCAYGCCGTKFAIYILAQEYVLDAQEYDRYLVVIVCFVGWQDSSG